MKTLHLRIDPENLNAAISREAIATAAAILRGGGLVAFPTETVYGLGADALRAESVEKIFAAKQRPAWDPLIVHISDRAMLSAVTAAAINDNCPAAALIEAFWPGPLTLLLPRADAIPLAVTAGRPLVGVRMPAHPAARALIAAARIPIAAPSANSFGRISPTRAAHVLEDLDGRIDAVLDGGETTHGLESTVVDASQEPVVVYRPGVITLQQIRDTCGAAIEWKPDETQTRPGPPESLPSPGVGIRHYAPRARLVLVSGGQPEQPELEQPESEQPAAFLQAVEDALRQHTRIGVMLPANFLPSAAANLIAAWSRRALVFDWGDWQNLPELAHRLFAGLRQLDAAGVSLILCPLPPPEGIGAAIRDRLLKAAKSA